MSIEIKSLPQDKIDKLMAQSRPFYLHHNRDDSYRFVYNKLMYYYGEPTTDKRKDPKSGQPLKLFEWEIWCFICATAGALKNGHPATHMSLNDSNYITANQQQERKKNTALSRERMSALTDKLHDDGFIIKYLGGMKSEGKSYQTSLYFTEKYLTLWEDIYLNNAKDLKTDEIFFRSRCKKKKLITKSKKFNGSQKIRAKLKTFNEMVMNSKIEMNGNRHRPCYFISYSTNALNIKDIKPTMGGRIYCHGGFQTLPSGKKESAFVGRKTILIDSQECTEVDFKAIHPSIAYDLKNIFTEPGFSPYFLPDDKNLYTLNPKLPAQKSVRALAKFALMIAINSSSPKEAIKTLNNDFNKDSWREFNERKYPAITKINAKEILLSLQAHNKGIEDSFFNDSGIRLQNIDGKICLKICHTLALEGICSLPWHDSFVVQKRHRERLKSVMLEAWAEVIGTTRNCAVEVEF